VLEGRVAVSTVPRLPVFTRNSPPNCATRSRIPESPTPSEEISSFFFAKALIAFWDTAMAVIGYSEQELLRCRMDAQLNHRSGASRVQLNVGKRFLDDSEEGGLQFLGQTLTPKVSVDRGSNLYSTSFPEALQVDTQRRKQSELIEHGGVTGARVYGLLDYIPPQELSIQSALFLL
jgi:hypothetical protein